MDVKPAKNNIITPEASIMDLTQKWLEKIGSLLHINIDEANQGERASFLAYAQSFPSVFLCLIDTYSVLKSGLLNFLAVALALNEYGYQAIGIRLDSGDLAYLSRKCREAFEKVSAHYNLPWVANLTIVASNDINEETLHSLKEQNHQINSFGIGTHLVTCQKQPALGCVFKLVEINNKPRMKLSEEVQKINLPGCKDVYRLFNKDGIAMLDLIQLSKEKPPEIGVKIMVRHPLIESKRAYVTPYKILKLHHLIWDGKYLGDQFPTLKQLRDRATESLKCIREDVKRELNPTPYKVSVSDEMYRFLHDLWLQNAPVGEIS